MSDPGSETRAERVRDLFDRLCDLTPDEREEYIRRAAPDKDVAGEVMKLLSRDARTHPVLDSGLVELAEGVGVSEGMAAPGRLIGPYRLGECLGRGGMGTVHLAVREDLGERVALKIVRGAIGEPSRRERFAREQRLLAQLEHPHIARFLDAGITDDETPYLAMELVEGEPITDWCRSRELELRERLRLFVQVCDAVGYAHRNLLVHRDIKPSNVFVTAESGVKLLDFGVAKLIEDSPDAWTTSDSARVLSPDYASPEQIRGEEVTTATDVHGLGLLLYEALTGRRPYRSDSGKTAEVIRSVLTDDALPPSTSVQRNGAPPGVKSPSESFALQLQGDVDAVVLKALSKDPEQRYANAEQFKMDVMRVLAHEPVEARPLNPLYRMRKFLRRHAAAATVALLRPFR